MTYLSEKVSFAGHFDDSKAAKVLLALIATIRSSSPDDETSRRCSLACKFVSGQLASEEKISILKEITSAPIGSEWKSFYAQAQLSAFFKKSVQFDFGVDTAAEAFSLFLKSEELCRKTNESLRDASSPNYSTRATLIFKMSRKIMHILGTCPSLDDLSFNFGPGTNVGCNKSTNSRHKLSADCTATVGCYRLMQTYHQNSQTWPGLNNIRLSRGSKFATVPKTSLTDRGINIEPILNSFVQKGVGAYIRKRLKSRAGVNLNDQTVNQLFARVGSKTGRYATIDLSMASDLISYNLVLDLLPFDWFVLLDSCRSPEVRLPDGSWIELEKFSSMGNGATFELESLIFYSLLQVVADDHNVTYDELSVYGDDLICPVEMYDSVCHGLELLGFIPNRTKSFSDGPFRESCGKDYFGGTEVRPVFLKEKMSMKELFRLHNYFFRQGYIPDAVDVILSFIRKRDRIFGPDGRGDGHLVTAHNKILTDKRGWSPYVLYRSYVAKPYINSRPLSGDYGAFLLGNERKEPSDDSVSETMFQERSRHVRYVLKNFRMPAAF